MRPGAAPAALSRGAHILAAAAVHAYTAFGGVLAFFTLVETATHHFERALLLLGLAFVVDGTDGFLARRVQVKRWLPTISGEALDLVIDFITYAIAPLFLLWSAGLLPQPAWLWAVVILAAAHYDFANTHPLKNQGLYTGLPAIWNLYAFYVYVLHPPEFVQAFCIAGLFVLTFAPIHFICLSRLAYLRAASLAATVICATIVLMVLLGLVADRRLWALVSLVGPAWYLGASLWVDLRFRRGALRLSPLPSAASEERG